MDAEVLYITGAGGDAGAPPGWALAREERLSLHLAEAAAGTSPRVAVLAANVSAPLKLARQVHLALPACHIVLFAAGSGFEALRASLARAPMIGERWSLVAQNDGERFRIIEEAAGRARREEKLRTTLQRANHRIAAASHEARSQQRQGAVEHYLASFLTQAQQALVGLDAALRIRYWNQSAAALFGIATAQAMALSLPDLPIWSEQLGQALDAVLRTRAGATVDCQLGAGTERRYLEMSICAVDDDDGRLHGLSLALRDVTERAASSARERELQLAATRQIQAQRDDLARMFDLAPGFMAVTRGPSHVFEMANRAYLALFGERTLIDAPLGEAFPELQDQAFGALRDQVYASGTAFLGRALPVLVDIGGKGKVRRYIDFVYQPIVGQDGAVSGIFCQGHDVTEQKLMQEGLLHHQASLEQLVADRTGELDRANRALHQSQKLEAIGKLTGGVAHDFNNILQVIGSNLDLMGVEFPGDDRLRARLKSCAGAVARGAKLASQLLSFARRQPLQPVPTSLGRTVQAMDELLRGALGEDIAVEVVIGGGLWSTLVDRVQLENVVLNLAINSRHAMPEGGRLTIEVGNAMLDDLYVSGQHDLAAGQYVMLAVSDTGSGMDQEVAQRAFEPFYSTKPEGQGTGLGLSMAYGFVKQSGGHIKIYSEPGLGTTVKIYLPRCHEAERALPQRAIQGVSGGDETILVVEDDDEVRAAVVDMLEGLGYAVVAAPDAGAALALLRTGLRMDLLFTDVVMPGALRSPELARLARQLHPGIAVLFTSGYTQNAIVHGGRLDPGVELLSKPYRRADLARKIREMLASAAPAAAPEPPARAALPRVVVVEDNDDARDMLAELLQMLGYPVAAFGGAGAALRELAAGDLLLTDVTLPGMSGIELARQATARFPGLKVIFVSGRDIEPLPFRHQKLPKPYTLERLQQVLDDAGR